MDTIESSVREHCVDSFLPGVVSEIEFENRSVYTFSEHCVDSSLPGVVSEIDVENRSFYTLSGHRVESSLPGLVSEVDVEYRSFYMVKRGFPNTVLSALSPVSSPKTDQTTAPEPQLFASSRFLLFLCRKLPPRFRG